ANLGLEDRLGELGVRLERSPVGDRHVAERMRATGIAMGGEPSYGKILGAVATFVQSLRSQDAPIDRYLNGDESAMPAEAIRGMKLFTGKAGCVKCHQGSRLADERLHCLGVPENLDTFRDAERHITFRRFMRTIGVGQCATLRSDIGYACVTKSDGDSGRFRTPSLRNVAETAPYMHNGSLATLEAVVDFYNDGGGTHKNKTSELEPLGLSKEEKADLVAFLGQLTCTAIKSEAVTPPPYATYEIYPTKAVKALNVEPIDNATFPKLAALPKVPVPADNPITPEKVELGKLLFFDDRLSGDVGTSCASCHDPRLGWGDGNALSRGYAGTQHWRNSQTIVNSAYLSKLFWAGESTSLEAQAQSAITGNLAGNGDTVMIEERLAQIPEYVELFKKAFGAQRPTFDHVLKSIATFERVETISKDSPFDEFLDGDEEALEEGALRGKALFEGKANCIRCHNGSLMSDEKYHAIGVPENSLFEEDPLRQISLRYQHYIRGVPESVYRNAKTDLGLYYTTKRKADIGRFRTPPLRHLEYTAPYMHNGAFETLEEVIEFYNEGGGDHPNKSRLLEPLNLTEDEQFDLLEFLESLSGDEIRMTPPELPQYQSFIKDEDSPQE
ncbi:MAG: cytochrome c peroxidase, partial [Planctomycetota bacterium]